MKKTIYTLTEGRTLEGLATNLEMFLKSKLMKVQNLELKNGSYILQARDADGKISQFVGGDMAITVKMEMRSEDSFTVEVGNGKWLDKVGGTVLGLLGAWPVLLLTAWSAYSQMRLPDKIHQRIQRYLYEEEKTEVVCLQEQEEGKLA